MIPCFNASRFLNATLDSVLAQTHPVREVILVDDGSTDDSAEIAESYGPAVRVIRQSNQGESVARNRGIEAAVGDWVAFVDADDIWERDKLERQMDALSGEEIACVCNVHYFGEVEKPAPPWGASVAKKATLEHICGFHAFLPSTLMVHRTTAPRFPTWTRYGEDYLYSLELAMRGPIAFVDRPLTRYRVHQGSQSAQWKAIVEQDKSLARWLQLHADTLGELRSHRLREIQVEVLAHRVRCLRFARRWGEYELAVEYLNTLREFPCVQKVLDERVWPRLVYQMVDKLDSVLSGVTRRGRI